MQKRSQVVFDKIIAAAKVLFKQHGYAYVSTNAIAERAKISIGSLYQYFANCESIALAVYEDACARAALTMKRKTLESFGRPIEASIPMHIGWVFDIFEKDQYALLQLIDEVPELRAASQPVSFDSLIHHTTHMFYQQHFTDIDRAVIVRKSYIIHNCVIGIIRRYLEERPDFMSREEAIAEITELTQQYIMTLSKSRHAAPGVRS